MGISSQLLEQERGANEDFLDYMWWGLGASSYPGDKSWSHGHENITHYSPPLLLIPKIESLADSKEIAGSYVLKCQKCAAHGFNATIQSHIVKPLINWRKLFSKRDFGICVIHLQENATQIWATR